MTWELIGYALTCVVAPVAWGLLVVRISNRIDRRLVERARSGHRPQAPRPIEYHI